MGWLNNWLADLESAPGPKPIAKAVTPQPKPEINEVCFQTRAPRDGDAGGCEAGFYSVTDGVVTMHDEKGVPTGKEYRLRLGEDARQIAGRMARDAWVKVRGVSDFNRPISYARFSDASEKRR